MATMVADSEIWHVLLSSDDMKRMNVDQLDDAFRLSLIDGSTLVWKNGMERWRRLCSLADLDESEELEELEEFEEFEEFEDLEVLEVVEGFQAFDASEEPTCVLQRSPDAFASLSPFRGAARRRAAAWPASPRINAPRAPAPVSVDPARSAASTSFVTSAVSPAPRVSAEIRAAAAAAFEAARVPVASTQPLVRPQLVAPVFPQQAQVRNHYVLPQGRADIPSELDFRRASGRVRWSRWLLALLVGLVGVGLGYRQNWLRAGARGLGIESAYLSSERRATAFVEASAPTNVRAALTWLSLLPGPNALPASPVAPESAPVPTAPAAAAAQPASSAVSASTPEAKTGLTKPEPLTIDEATLASDEPSDRSPPEPQAQVAAKPSVAWKPTSEPKRTTKAAAKPTAAARPKAAAKPKVRAPKANESALDAAIRRAVVKGAKK